jgi:hypothetical protein
MQLRKARLCLDCEELHDLDACPICASEAYAFLTQWMPAPERRRKPRPSHIPELERLRRPEAEDADVPVLSALVRWNTVGVGLFSRIFSSEQ